MTPYKIAETNHFQKSFKKKASAFEHRLIRKKLSESIYPRLRNNPRAGHHIKKLKGVTPETYRYRIGNFRLFYTIDEAKKIVVITAIRHRSTAYR